MRCRAPATAVSIFSSNRTAAVWDCAYSGATPAADEARFLADRLRIRLTDSPDDAPVVLVATQGQGDEEALEAALRSSARHVLMIASRRKADRLRAVMRMRGIDESQLARLQAPAGPDAGAKTPDEIALMAIAGVLASLRGRSRRAGGAAETAGQDSGRPISPKAPGTASADVRFVNPVCGVAVSTANALHVENYAGVSYYFCCDGCWTTFLKDPGKYAAIHQASMGGAVPA